MLWGVRSNSSYPLYQPAVLFSAHISSSTSVRPPEAGCTRPRELSHEKRATFCNTLLESRRVRFARVVVVISSQALLGSAIAVYLPSANCVLMLRPNTPRGRCARPVPAAAGRTDRGAAGTAKRFVVSARPWPSARSDGATQRRRAPAAA